MHGDVKGANAVGNEKEIKSLVSSLNAASSSTEPFHCPLCGSEVVLFVWPIYICMVCHQRRNERPAPGGQTFPRTMEIDGIKEHSDERPL